MQGGNRMTPTESIPGTEAPAEFTMRTASGDELTVEIRRQGDPVPHDPCTDFPNADLPQFTRPEWN